MMPRGERVRRKKMERPDRSQKSSLPIGKEQEGSKIYLWRLRQLRLAGMPNALAKKIADSDFDLHKALDMLAAGCSPETLLDIAL
jgi:hypothetical protein